MWPYVSYPRAPSASGQVVVQFYINLLKPAILYKTSSDLLLKFILCIDKIIETGVPIIRGIQKLHF